MRADLGFIKIMNDSLRDVSASEDLKKRYMEIMQYAMNSKSQFLVDYIVSILSQDRSIREFTQSRLDDLVWKTPHMFPKKYLPQVTDFYTFPDLIEDNSPIANLRFILPESFESEGIERRIYVATELLRYIEMGRSLGFIELTHDYSQSLEAHVIHFVITQSQREELKNSLILNMTSDIGERIVQSEIEYELIMDHLMRLEGVKSRKGWLNEKYFSSALDFTSDPSIRLYSKEQAVALQKHIELTKAETFSVLISQLHGQPIDDRTIEYVIENDQTIVSGAGTMYNAHDSGKRYRTTTKVNPTYTIPKNQEELLNQSQGTSLFEIEDTCDELQLYFLGGGALEEETEFIVHLIRQNIDHILTKGEDYKIRLISVDINEGQLTQAAERRVNSRIYEEINRFLYHRLPQNDKSKYIEYKPNFKIETVAADFLTQDYSVKTKEAKNVERIMFSGGTTISNYNDEDIQKMMNQSYELIRKVKAGKLIIGAALEGSNTRYNHPAEVETMTDFVGGALFENGAGFDREDIAFAPHYDIPRKTHILDFEATRGFSKEYIDEKGIKHILNFKPGARINVINSRRFNQDQLIGLAHGATAWLDQSDNLGYTVECRTLENKYAFLEMKVIPATTTISLLHSQLLYANA